MTPELELLFTVDLWVMEFFFMSFGHSIILALLDKFWQCYRLFLAMANSFLQCQIDSGISIVSGSCQFLTFLGSF